MSDARSTLRFVPTRLHPVLRRHDEAVKFLLVGGTCFLLTALINYALKLSVLGDKPVTALTIATIISAVVSYVLNREWSFRTRGGRERHHEAALFFLFSAIAIGINSIPLSISRYVLELRTPIVSTTGQEIADFVSGMILGTLLAMAFRLWTFKRYVFPKQGHPAARAGRAERAELRPHRTPTVGRTVKHKPSAHSRAQRG